MSIRAWLDSAGLGEYAPRFAALTEPEFKALLMAEYGKFGITDLGAKQRLYNLLKSLNSSDSLGGHYAHRPVQQQQQDYHQQHHMLNADGLLDLDEHDSDLLVPVSARPIARPRPNDPPPRTPPLIRRAARRPAPRRSRSPR